MYLLSVHNFCFFAEVIIIIKKLILKEVGVKMRAAWDL
jgi:hypothetical protein